EEQQIEVTIPMTDLLLRAEEQHTDLYAAIDLVVDKLERQIRKYKTKVNRKFRQKGAPKHIFAEMEEEAIAAEKEENDADGEIEIVRTKRFNLKPMDSEEAILQMDMLGHAFFVFTNAETDDTNVVYKRKAGRYGLIEPMNQMKKTSISEGCFFTANYSKLILLMILSHVRRSLRYLSNYHTYADF